MKTLQIDQLQDLNGGDFCTGFTAGMLAYEAGVLLTLWNPISVSVALVGVGVASACWLEII